MAFLKVVASAVAAWFRTRRLTDISHSACLAYVSSSRGLLHLASTRRADSSSIMVGPTAQPTRLRGPMPGCPPRPSVPEPAAKPRPLLDLHLESPPPDCRKQRQSPRPGGRHGQLATEPPEQTLLGAPRPQSLGSTPQAVLIQGLHRSFRGQNQASTQQSKGQPTKGGKLGMAWCNQSTRSGGICGTGAQWGIHRLRKENRGS